MYMYGSEGVHCYYTSTDIIKQQPIPVEHKHVRSLASHMAGWYIL